jgi:hypothetical protein
MSPLTAIVRHSIYLRRLARWGRARLAEEADHHGPGQVGPDVGQRDLDEGRTVILHCHLLSFIEIPYIKNSGVGRNAVPPLSSRDSKGLRVVGRRPRPEDGGPCR